MRRALRELNVCCYPKSRPGSAMVSRRGESPSFEEVVVDSRCKRCSRPLPGRSQVACRSEFQHSRISTTPFISGEQQDPGSLPTTDIDDLPASGSTATVTVPFGSSRPVTAVVRASSTPRWITVRRLAVGGGRCGPFSHHLRRRLARCSPHAKKACRRNSRGHSARYERRSCGLR